jgi:hypothetical protein
MTVRRLKTYTAETGSVYQYYFVGKRRALAQDPEAPAIEFIFDVNAGQQPIFAISIFLRDESVEHWQQIHGRALVDTELYAAAKMMLFRAFDEVENLMQQGRRCGVGAQELENLLAQLDVDA